jgi:hypothetical protein
VYVSGLRRLVSILLLGLSVIMSAPTAFADSFDVPLKKKIVDFGLSENNPPGRQNFRVRLHCLVYQNFMIKEYDNEGAKGAQWVSIVPIRNGMAPACSLKHATGDRVFEPPKWFGYFKGVKGNLVFLEAPDGTIGGMPFDVYDFRTGRKIFSDSAYESNLGNKEVPFNQMRFSGTQDRDLTMTYMRVVKADCDLHTEGAACWDRIRKKLQLENTQRPVCTGYESFPEPSESAIAYLVEVSLFPLPVIKTVAGPVKCWRATE